MIVNVSQQNTAQNSPSITQLIIKHTTLLLLKMSFQVFPYDFNQGF